MSPSARTLSPDRSAPERVREAVRWALGIGLALGVLGAVRAASPRHSPRGRVELGAAEIRRGQDGSPERWQERDVAILIDPAVEEGVPGATDAVREAFAAWQVDGVELPRFSVAVATSTESSPQVDGLNRVLYGPIEIPAHRNALAITEKYVDGRTGEILEADLWLNSRHGFAVLPGDAEQKAVAAQSGCRERHEAHQAEALLTSCGTSARAAATCGNRYDLRAVLTHEAGHFLGLGEDPTESGATMYYCTSPCETHKRQPGASDIQALGEVYAGAFEDREAPSCAVAPVGSAPTRAGSVLWAGCGLLVAGLLGRRLRPCGPERKRWRA